MRNPIVTLIIGLVIGLAIAAGAFFLGINQGQAQAADQQSQFLRARGFDPNATGGAGGGGGQFGGGAGGRGGLGAFFGGGPNGAAGTISKVDGTTLTLTVPNSPDVTVSTGSGTTVLKIAKGDFSDFKVGQRITVSGTRSGSNIGATNITITDLPAGVTLPTRVPRATPTPGP